MLPLGGPRGGGGGGCRCWRARGPVGMHEYCKRGDVCGPGEGARAAGGSPLSNTGDVEPGLIAGVGSAWIVPGCLLAAIAAGAVGGDRSDVDFGPLPGGPCGFGTRGEMSNLAGGSGASSRRTRCARGVCGGPRSALGPVGGCTDGREGGSLRSFSALSTEPVDVVSPRGLSAGGPGMGTVTEPNAGTCGADGGGERLTGGMSLGGSGRGGRDSGRSASRRGSAADGLRA